MAAYYTGKNTIKKLTELVLTELGKKQDKIDEITAEEVRRMWADEDSELKDPDNSSGDTSGDTGSADSGGEPKGDEDDNSGS